MSSNQQIVLNTILEQKRKEMDETLPESFFFNLFVVDQVLKDYELSYDEINEGIVEGGCDGGIDALYTFVNGDLIQRDSDLIDVKRNAKIELFIIQSKSQTGFGETPIEKCNSSAIDLFNLGNELDGLRAVYNNNLLTNIGVFRNQYLKTISKFPVIEINYIYASKGIEVHNNVKRKVAILENTVKGQFSSAMFSFEFLTADRLLELNRKDKIESKGMLLKDNPISTQDGGYIALVPIKSFLDFISDENGDIIRYFFDANIRDYQGKVEVNRAIEKSLKEQNPQEDFWWLNNGVTITAARASFASKSLHIEDPQIVNGLQTSFEIYNYFKFNKIEDDDRNILIRVISWKNEMSRLKVIKATNSQTTIPPASLRATDPIHRDIEDFLYSKSYYYDRRKNYHKNQGKPINRIISIPYLAQIVMSVFLRQPDYARARPSTLIKNNDDYNRIFNNSIPVEMYLKAIQVQKIVENALT